MRDVCLAVRPGQVVALVGPNGSGKTTILRTVAGQLRALGGRVELFGRELGDIDATQRARTMSVMLTGRPRTELLTCRDVVEAGRHPYTGRLGVLGERDDAVVASLHEVDLAQKAADHVICIKDGRVAFQGPPGEVLTAERVAELYDLAPGTYDPAFGSVELVRPEGAPEVFVIAGGGTGAACFRALARNGTPFATGVLHEHDTDGLLEAARAAGIPVRTGPRAGQRAGSSGSVPSDCIQAM